MLYQLRTGDVILCENKKANQTNAYLIVYDNDNGFGLWFSECAGSDSKRIDYRLFEQPV